MPSQPLLSPPPFFVSIEDSYKRGLRGLSRRDCLVFPPTAAVLPCSTGRRRHLLMHPSRSFFGASISRFSFASFTFVCLKIYVCLFALGSMCRVVPSAPSIADEGRDAFCHSGLVSHRYDRIPEHLDSWTAGRQTAATALWPAQPLRPQQSPIVLVDGRH